MTVHEWLAEWSGWLWPLFANHLWQATLFSTLAFTAVLVLRRGPSRARYAIWMIAGLKFALPSALLALLIAAAGFDMSSSGAASTENEGGAFTAVSQFTAPIYELSEADAGTGSSGDHNELYCGLTFAWLSGVAILLGLWVKRRLRFSRALKAGRAVTSGREAEAFDRARTLLGATRQVSLIISSRVVEPGVWRVVRPVILLPEGMADDLSCAELEAVLAHEMIHVARWDNLVSNLNMAICCLLWFHPMVWLIDRRLLVEREQSCDEAVIRLGGGSEVYASGLLKVLKFCIGWRLAGVSNAAGSNLRRRVERIMANHGDALRISHRVVVGTVAGLVIAFSIAAGLASRGQVAAQVYTVFESDSQGGVQTRQPRRDRGGIPGGVPGGVQLGIPGGVTDGIPGGVPGGVPGGIPDGVPGGVPGGVAGGIPGGVPGGIPGGVPGGIPGGVPGGVPGVETGQLPSNINELLDQTPDTPVHFTNENGTPFKITEATLKAVKDRWLRPSDGSNTGTDYYVIRPSVTLLNTTNRVITGFALYLVNGESKNKIYFGQARLRIEPPTSLAFSGYQESMRMPGSPEAFTVTVLQVGFEDGSEWGTSTPRRLPPAPASEAPQSAPPDQPTEPFALHKVQPAYPAIAKRQGVSGSVVIDVTIDEEGKVSLARGCQRSPRSRRRLLRSHTTMEVFAGNSEREPYPGQEENLFQLQSRPTSEMTLRT